MFITFNFIIKLLILKDLTICNGYNNIFIIVNRFIKFFYFILYNKDTDIKQMVYIFLRYIIIIYGFIFEIISDKGIIFILKF